MSRVITQALALMGIYLLVLTSAKPGDAAAGFAARRSCWPWRCGRGSPAAGRPRRRWPGSSRFGPVLAMTAVEMARGSWRTARFCLRGGGAARASSRSRAAGRSRHAVALWGVLTGEAPDEVPVDVDEERDVLIVHLVDASDPDAVRERHRRAYERAQRKVVA